MAGLIKSISVDEGEKVRKGQTIANLDNSLIRAEINTLETPIEFGASCF